MAAGRYSTILFDFDGTITPSFSLWLAAFQHVFTQYQKQIKYEQLIEHCYNRPIEEIIRRFGLAATVPDFKEHLRIGLEASFTKAVLYDGVEDVLALCAALKIKLGLVTSSPRAVVDRALSGLGIGKYFGATVTADDITEFKPHPEPVHLALNLLHGNVQDCLIIGDSSGDILAGHAVGIVTALFFPEEHHDFHRREDLMKTNPHFVFSNYQEIAAHIEAAGAAPKLGSAALNPSHL